MRNFFPKTGFDTEWNDAYYRLEDYLRALHVVNRVQQSQIILGLLESAARKHAEQPETSPTVLAMAEARTALNRWLEHVLARPQPVEVSGLVALLATDAPARWPAEFLADDISPAFQRAMQECEVMAGPALAVSSMVPHATEESPSRIAVNRPALWTRFREGVISWW